MTTEALNKKRWHNSGGALLLEFFGSMNLAITLLVTVGIASIVGTVLKQNEPYQNYISRFGPFWFEVFNSLGLYDVYSAAWFLLILTFLVLSTGTCIYRNAPLMLHDMRSYRLGVRFNSLNAFHNKREWRLQTTPEALFARVIPVLEAFGYRVRSKDCGDHRVIAAKKGAINRLGYIFTHSAIVIICIGGLVDGNLLLHDPEAHAPLAATIAVNHPLLYKGYAIYQASFSSRQSHAVAPGRVLRSPATAMRRLPLS